MKAFLLFLILLHFSTGRIAHMADVFNRPKKAPDFGNLVNEAKGLWQKLFGTTTTTTTPAPIVCPPPSYFAIANYIQEELNKAKAIKRKFDEMLKSRQARIRALHAQMRADRVIMEDSTEIEGFDIEMFLKYKPEAEREKHWRDVRKEDQIVTEYEEWENQKGVFLEDLWSAINDMHPINLRQKWMSWSIPMRRILKKKANETKQVTTTSAPSIPPGACPLPELSSLVEFFEDELIEKHSIEAKFDRMMGERLWRIMEVKFEIMAENTRIIDPSHIEYKDVEFWLSQHSEVETEEYVKEVRKEDKVAQAYEDWERQKGVFIPWIKHTMDFMRPNTQYLRKEWAKAGVPTTRLLHADYDEYM